VNGVNGARYATLWHELHDYFQARRPVDLWTGVPVLDDDELEALVRRWGRVIDDHADDLGDEYPELAAWWREQLDSAADDPIDRVRRFWEASLDLADELAHLSDVGAPASVDTDWILLHGELRTQFEHLRGIGPDGAPDTTRADARRLTSIWDRLAAVGERIGEPATREAVDRWRAFSGRMRATLDDCAPDAVCADNNELWQLSEALATRVEHALRRSAGQVRDADAKDRADLVRFRGMKDWLELHMALKSYFDERRGYDLEKNGKIHIPRTTNDDVRQLLAIWDRLAGMARLDVFGVKGAVSDWRAFSTEAKRLLKDADPDAVFPKNYELWRVSQRLAIRGQTGNEEPPPFDFWDALEKNVKRAPERIATALGVAGEAAGKVAGASVDAVETVAGGAANVVKAAAGPLLRPVLIGAGVVGAGALAIVLLRK